MLINKFIYSNNSRQNNEFNKVSIIDGDYIHVHPAMIYIDLRSIKIVITLVKDVLLFSYN